MTKVELEEIISGRLKEMQTNFNKILIEKLGQTVSPIQKLVDEHVISIQECYEKFDRITDNITD